MTKLPAETKGSDRSEITEERGLFPKFCWLLASLGSPGLCLLLLLRVGFINLAV